MGRKKEKKRKFKSLSYSDETLQAIETIIDRINLYQRQEEDPQRSLEFISPFLGKSGELDAAIAEGLARIPSKATAIILMEMKADPIENGLNGLKGFIGVRRAFSLPLFFPHSPHGIEISL